MLGLPCPSELGGEASHKQKVRCLLPAGTPGDGDLGKTTGPMMQLELVMRHDGGDSVVGVGDITRVGDATGA